MHNAAPLHAHCASPSICILRFIHSGNAAIHYAVHAPVGGPQVDDDFRSLSLTSIIDALPPRPLPLSKSANHPPSTCGSPNSIPLFAVGAMQPTHLSDPTVETRGDQVVYSSDERLGSLLVYYVSAVGQSQTVKHQTETAVGRLWTLALYRSPHPCDHGRCGIHQSQNTACYSHPISPQWTARYHCP
ncbi:hypothetical protein LY78DRAFT_302935 [Colletotrichum sublineola]|nr:hypothetical protein LY78DRAFT_302935 [Colletotrichum sublineola]